MKSEHLPIFKATLDLCVYIDTIVKNQERYYKYSIGDDLRRCSKEILFYINRANRAKNSARVVVLQQLVERCEKLKSLVILTKELKAFKSFKQFEHSSKQVVNICKQAQAWLNSSAGMIR